MNSALRISVDYDNTIANTSVITTALLNFKTGSKYKAEDINSWDWWKEIGEIDSFWAIYDMFDKTYLRRSIPPMGPFATAVVKWLIDEGVHVDILTGNHVESVPSIQAWCFMHGIDAPVIAVGRTNHGKAGLDYDIFIDDYPGLAEQIREYKDKTLLLYDRPYNQGIELPSNTHRCKDWLEILDFLRGYLNGYGGKGGASK